MRRRRAVLVLAALPCVAGCGLEPFELRRSQEIPPGPGLFTGERGVFTLPPARRPEPATSLGDGGAAEVPNEGGATTGGR